ncbi:MAG TPA: pirin family protein [Polyangiales bacterium]|nr:pirin family protein [Polyangiales bacterium]
MITLRRSDARHHVQGTGREQWASFHPEHTGDGFALGFGPLERFDEHRLDARASVLVHPSRGVEVVSYVLTGVVASRDAALHTSMLHAGDFQRVSGSEAGGLRQSNASRSLDACVIQLWLRHDSARHSPVPEQRSFSAAERRGGLRLVASEDARDGTLRLKLDVLIYSALLDTGQHLVHELKPRRSAWLHVIRGAVSCEDTLLDAGDAASFALQRAASWTARMPSEVLLVDLAHLASAPHA